MRAEMTGPFRPSSNPNTAPGLSIQPLNDHGDWQIGTSCTIEALEADEPAHQLVLAFNAVTERLYERTFADAANRYFRGSDPYGTTTQNMTLGHGAARTSMRSALAWGEHQILTRYGGHIGPVAVYTATSPVAPTAAVPRNLSAAAAWCRAEPTAAFGDGDFLLMPSWHGLWVDVFDDVEPLPPLREVAPLRQNGASGDV